MPFIKNTVDYIDQFLKKGSLNKEKLQPMLMHGLSTVVGRSVKGSKDPNKLEMLPAIIDGYVIKFITPDQKIAMQTYHKMTSNIYSLESKNSYGDEKNQKSVTELTMVVITNSKLTGRAKEVLEPVVLFGMPQRLDASILSDLNITSCLITALGSNTDHFAVFKQEYPQSNYFLTEQISIFSIRYKVEMSYSQKCVEQCLCD